MTVIAQTAYAKIGNTYGSAAAGQAVGYVAADVAGDYVPLVGQFVIVTWKSAGTGATITLDSVRPSDQGSDQNVVITMAATDEQEICLVVEDRFKQTSGNVGYAKFTYSSVTNLSIRAKYIP